jgi:phosphatidylglycerophosphate synthase
MRIALREFFYVSNLLSLSRILLIPPIWLCIQLQTRTGDLALLGLIGLAIVTDVLDGYLARRLDQQTELGRVLDPLTDKIALIVLLAAGVIFRGFPKMLVLLLFYRDIVILVFGTIVSKRIGRGHAVLSRGPRRCLAELPLTCVFTSCIIPI